MPKEPGAFYSYAEVAALLEKAEAQGMDLEPNSPLEALTVHQLDVLVNVGPE